MGITVHYRGRMDDLQRIEDFEDRVLDVAMELGAPARIWRTVADRDPSRRVCGLIVDLAPGQESTSLLISPEGWLVNLTEIEDAEKGNLTEPSWCSVKTQFGPVSGHVTLIELLSAIQREFMSNLEVKDEAEYWQHRDLQRLADKFHFLGTAISSLATELNRFGLSSEAAEDPEIIAARVERVAHLVQQTMKRPSEHPPVDVESLDEGMWTHESEKKWSAWFREYRRKQERLKRAIEERMAAGEDHRTALENAMRDEGMIDWSDDNPQRDEVDELLDDLDPEQKDSWLENLPAGDEVDDESFGDSKTEHPLSERASKFHVRLYQLFEGSDKNASRQVDVLWGGLGDLSGGLAQATSGLGDNHPAFDVDTFERGLSIVQLKRALRGAAFVSGALIGLAHEEIISKPQFEELYEIVSGLRDDIFSLLQEFRGE